MSQYPRIIVIVNPISGTKDKENIVETLRHNPLCQVMLTEGPGDAVRFAKMAARTGARAVIAVGGDGTVRETALGLLGSDTPLGIIPAGSGNGLARHLGIPLNPSQALEVLGKCHVVRCDYGLALGRPFFCTMGVGFDAEVSDCFARSARRGPISYVKSVLSVYHSYKAEDYRITLPDRVIERRAMLVTVANAAQYGNNAMIAPDASVTDGMLDVTILLDGNRIHTIEAALQLFTGRVYRNPLVETFRVSHLTIERISAPADSLITAHLDGEPTRLPNRIDVGLRCASLPIITLPGRKV